MKWFKHGSNMRNDAKLRRVINRYGLEGYGLYNLIVESIVESLDNDSPIPILEEGIEDIAEFYHSNTSRIEEMLHFMVNQGLFDFTKNKEIVCIKVFKHLQSSQTRSIALRQLIKNYDENKPDLLELSTVSDSLLLVTDHNKDDLNDNTSVTDICEEENRIRIKENKNNIYSPVDDKIIKPKILSKGFDPKKDYSDQDPYMNAFESNPKIPYSEIIDFLNKTCGTSYRSTTEATRGKIKARFNEGFTVDDFKTVITNQSRLWLKTEYEQYLRPITLFGSKFESYLNNIQKESKPDKIDYGKGWYDE